MTIFSPAQVMIPLLSIQARLYLFLKGYLHHIENINHGETKFAIAFNHEMPEDIGISGSTGSMTDKYLEPHSDLDLNILAISRNLIMIYS